MNKHQLAELEKRRDALADIYWWLKGNLAGSADNFGYEHVIAMRDEIRDLRERIDTAKKEGVTD